MNKTFVAWRDMKLRCDDSNRDNYKWYGARGISYDSRWSSFKLFLEDMGEAPKGTQLDRINNNGNYYKENCRWATRLEAARNRSDNKMTERKVILLRALLKAKNPCVSLRKFYEVTAQVFGIYKGTVARICSEEYWKFEGGR